MLPIVVMFLSGLAVLAMTVGVIMFFDVALEAPGEKTSRAMPNLPLLQGDALRRWAASFAQSIVGQYKKMPRTSQTAVSLAAELERKTSHLIDQSTGGKPAPSDTRCASCREEPIGVTAPEVFAIAEELRRGSSARSVRQLRKLAQWNSQSSSPDNEKSGGPNRCPLFGEDGQCRAFVARPIYCRGQCPECIVGASPEAGSEARAFAWDVGTGVTDGLRKGLAEAGLDAGLYELNSALAVALEKPEAAARWARGEPVFAACKTVDD